MGLFFNRFDAYKSRGMLVSALDDILEASRKGGYAYDRVALERFRARLSNYLPTKKTFKTLYDYLNEYVYTGVGENGSAVFVNQAIALMLDKGTQTTDIIRNNEASTEDMLSDTIKQLTAEIRAIEANLQSLSVKITNALQCGDKTGWRLYVTEKNSKTKALQIKQKTLNVLLQQKSNLTIAEELRLAEQRNSELAKAGNIINIGELEEITETLQATAEEIDEDAAAIGGLVVDEDDFDFDRAREEYLLTQNVQLAKGTKHKTEEDDK